MKRKTRTEDLIKEAFEQLLVKKPLNKITNEEIAAKAGVGVATVYRHYHSKEEIIMSIILPYFRLTLVYSNYRDATYHFLKETYKKRRFFKALIRNGYSNFIGLGTRSGILAVRSQGLNPYLLQFMVGGVSSIIINWFETDCATSPSDLTDTIIALVYSFHNAEKKRMKALNQSSS